MEPITITLKRAVFIIKQHGNLDELEDFFKTLGRKKECWKAQLFAKRRNAIIIYMGTKAQQTENIAQIVSKL